MNVSRFLFLVPVLLLMLAVTQAASTAEAKSKVTGSGTFSIADFVVTDEREDDGEVILTARATVELKGAFNGTLDCHHREVIEPSGESDFRQRCSFTGSVDGRAGTARFRVVGETAADGSSEGHFSVFDGDGRLDGLRARGTFEGPPDGPGTYSATIHLPDHDNDDDDDDD